MTDDDFIAVYVAECGDELEVWEPLPKVMAFCDTCKEFHEYLPDRNLV